MAFGELAEPHARMLNIEVSAVPLPAEPRIFRAACLVKLQVSACSERQGELT
jgi:hypothetical protein